MVESSNAIRVLHLHHNRAVTNNKYTELGSDGGVSRIGVLVEETEIAIAALAKTIEENL